MNLRFGAYLVGAVCLAACAQALSGSHSSSLLPAESLRRGLPDKPAPAPSYSLVGQLPERTIRPNMLQATVGSAKATTVIVGRKKIDLQTIKAPTIPPCDENGSGHTVSGCEVFFVGSTTIDIKRATFDIYKGSGKHACLLATARFKGDVSVNSPVASTFEVAKNSKKPLEIGFGTSSK
jgi:hypothetical protein